jgi:hypothetical protein
MAPRLLASALAAALLGCAAPHPPPPSSVVTLPTIAASQPVTAAPARLDACRVARVELDRVVAKADARAREVLAEGGKPATPIRFPESARWVGASAPQYCWASGRGAWALLPDQLLFHPSSANDEEWEMDAHVVLAHIDERGTIVRQEIETLQEAGNTRSEFGELADANCCSDFASSGVEVVLLHDFDGDGEKEVYLKSTYSIEGSYKEYDALFSFRDDRLAPYAHAASIGFREIEDVTKDGRPDLLVYEYLDGGESCGSGFPYGGNGPKFLAHALPDGTFSETDAEAVAYAKTWCPRLPATLETTADVVCAKLWGDSEETLQRKIDKRWAPMDCDAAVNGKPQKPKATQDYELLMSATRAKVPFRLR